MATPTSTGKSAALVKPNNSASSLSATCPELELPVVSDFVSLTPESDKRKILEISDVYVRKLCKRPGFWKFRAEDRCDIEFDLQHPERVLPSYPAELIDEVLRDALYT